MISLYQIKYMCDWYKSYLALPFKDTFVSFTCKLTTGIQLKSMPKVRVLAVYRRAIGSKNNKTQGSNAHL